MADTKTESFALLGDAPVLEAGRPDLLNFQATARVLAGATIETKNPLTIGVFGEWGSGKTSLMRLIKSEVAKNDGNVAVWFNAWQFEKEEHLIVPLVATINKELEKAKTRKSWKGKISKAADEMMKALKSIAYGFSVKGKVGIPLISEAEVNLSAKDMVTRFQDLTKDAMLSRSLYFDAFERLEECVTCGDAPRIVVFVDDLDRCFPDKAVELLEHIKLVLHQPGFAFVLGVHEDIIQAVVKKKYEKDFNLDPAHAEDYLHKIAQVHIYVPSRQTLEMTAFIGKLLDEAGVKLGDAEAESIKARESAIPLIAEAGKHNPRGIIRFLNRIIVTSRIGSLDGSQYDFLALVIDQATKEPRYRRFCSSLDLKFEKTDLTVGRFLADELARYEGSHADLSTAISHSIKERKSASLEMAIDTLQKNEHLFNLLKSQVGLNWLRDKDYRHNVGEAQERAVGKAKQEERKKDEASQELAEPIKELLIQMVNIPSGSFEMGGNENKEEKPIHKVILKSFEISATPVTQAQYKAIMGENPSGFPSFTIEAHESIVKAAFKGEHPMFSRGLKNPVEKVSWPEAMEFCEKLSALTGRKFTLPSEAQWEYACRAGSKSKYYFGDSDLELEKYAWFAANSDEITHPVGVKKPNHWGLFDMYGNVWEWCLDHWHPDYQGAPVDGSAWIDEMNFAEFESRVTRGGALKSSRANCRSASRGHMVEGDHNRQLGFRVIALPQASK